MSRFREIEGYNGYIIYDDGRVYSSKTNKFLSYRVNKSGYRYVNLCNNGKIHEDAKKFLDKNKEYELVSAILYGEWDTLKMM